MTEPGITLHLIRHGQTAANAQQRYCGRTDLPLSPEGVTHLQALKAQGIYPPAEMFYTSGMLRTKQTLAILYGDVKAVTIPDLAEFDFGAFEMRRYEALRHDPAYIAWITDESGEVACPGGESKRQHEQRTLNGFAHLLSTVKRSAYRTATVVAHGGTIVAILSHLFQGERNFYEWQPLPGLGYTLCQNRDGLFTYQHIEERYSSFIS